MGSGICIQLPMIPTRGLTQLNFLRLLRMQLLQEKSRKANLQLKWIPTLMQSWDGIRMKQLLPFQQRYAVMFRGPQNLPQRYYTKFVMINPACRLRRNQLFILYLLKVLPITLSIILKKPLLLIPRQDNLNLILRNRKQRMNKIILGMKNRQRQVDIVREEFFRSSGLRQPQVLLHY